MSEAHTDTARVIEKIRKLLALASSANEHEAHAALAQAQKLMDAHRISMDAVEGASPHEGTTEPIEVDQNPLIAPAAHHAKWRVLLFSMIAAHNGCQGLVRRTLTGYTRRNGRAVAQYTTSYVAVGRESDRIMTRFVFDFCERALEELLAARSTIKSKSARNAYRWGVAIAIDRTLKEERKRADQMRHHAAPAASHRALRENNSALAVIDRRLAQVEDWMSKSIDGLKTEKTSSAGFGGSDRGSLARGLYDGKSIRIPGTPVSGAEKLKEIASSNE